MGAQLELALNNLDKVLSAAGMSLANLVRLNVYPSARSESGPHQTRRVATKRHGTSPTMSREQRGAVRDCANNNGYTVGDRGRIKAEIVAAFEAAH